jgi:hypothetical protein
MIVVLRYRGEVLFYSLDTRYNCIRSVYEANVSLAFTTCRHEHQKSYLCSKLRLHQLLHDDSSAYRLGVMSILVQAPSLVIMIC